jgi:CubicO group peptidase (beta-lactamase class C family)
MKLLICLAASLLGASAAAAAPGTDPRKAALDRDMPAILARHKVPSLSVAHVAKGRIAFAAAYGEQSPGVPATPDTLYNVASLTKPISAEVVLRLASANRLSLDEPMHLHWASPTRPAPASAIRARAMNGSRALRRARPARTSRHSPSV